MSRSIGDRLPAPLRFELGIQPVPGEPARAVLAITMDDDGSPRVAVLSTSEIAVLDDRRLRLELRRDSTSAANMIGRGRCAIWYVLDGAAYTIGGSVRPSDSPAAEEAWQALEIAVNDVRQDFHPGAPMIAGPTYRAAGNL